MIARRDSQTFVTFVQRLGFVERPDGETLAFLVGIYNESQRESAYVRSACAHALGTSVGRAYVWGLTEEAIRASEALRRDLLLATSSVAKCALVSALGKAGIESDVGVILRFVDDPDPRVRAAAALALRKMHSREARQALITLLGEEESVADSALAALSELSLSHDDVIRITELVLSGRTPLSLDGRVLRFDPDQEAGGVAAGSSD